MTGSTVIMSYFLAGDKNQLKESKAIHITAGKYNSVTAASNFDFLAS